MKLITLLLFLLPSLTLWAQLDDYCPCMDPPKYFDDSYLDSLLLFEEVLSFPTTETDHPNPLLVTDRYFEEQEVEITLVELVNDKPINISPSTPEKRINVSPKEEVVVPKEKVEKDITEKAETSSSVKRNAIKHKRKRRQGKVKRRKRAKKYKGKCPLF